MTVARIPLLCAAFVAAAIALFATAPAWAAEHLTTTISDAKVTDGNLQGVLTFRSASAVDVDPGSVKASVDGKDVPITVQKSTYISRSALLVIDTSGSMGASGMATVRAAVATYLREAPPDVKVGVVTFATTAGVDLQPTQDREAVQHVVDGLKSNGDTSLYAAVRDAATALGSGGDRSIVLLSDGADTMSKDPSGDLAKAAAALKAKQIRVDVVRFNNNDPVAVKALQQFADVAGGSVISAKDPAAVGLAFQKAARTLQSQAQFKVQSMGIAGTHTLTISGTAGSVPFTATQTVDFLAAPPSAVTSAASSVPIPAPTPTVPIRTHSTLPWFAAGVVGLALFLLAYGLLNPTFKSQREQRLANIEAYASSGTHAAREKVTEQSRSLGEQMTALADRATRGRKWTDRTMELINRADLPFRAGEWAILRLASAVTGAALFMILLGHARLVGFIVGTVAGAVLPAFFLRWKAGRRASAFERLLPQALMLASTSLRSGFSLAQALESVARDSPEPVAKEISRALAETRIGTDIADALDRVSERMGTESMKMTVMAIRIQREVGGNLAETLETTARTLRDREALYGQVRALSAEGKLSAYILIALPIGLFLYMMMVNYAYVSLLWTTFIGLIMLVGAVVSLTIGIFWMRKTVQIEV